MSMFPSFYSSVLLSAGLYIYANIYFSIDQSIYLNMSVLECLCVGGFMYVWI